jgi:hypothetical protein
MWAVWLVVGTAALLMAAMLLSLAPAFRAAPRSWRVLSASGLPLSVGGIGFAIRFWDPTAGPYLANRVYPYGSHLNAWAVSFGFTWLAFGLLFTALTLLGSRAASRVVWGMLLGSWLICWLPHGVIAVAFAWAGENTPSFDFYARWASQPIGYSLLLSSSLILVAHFGLSLLGFVMTGLDLRRGGSGAGGAGETT